MPNPIVKTAAERTIPIDFKIVIFIPLVCNELLLRGERTMQG